MDIKDLRKKSDIELRKMFAEKAQTFANFKFGMSGSKVKNVREGRVVRKEMAQILTVLNEPKVA